MTGLEREAGAEGAIAPRRLDDLRPPVALYVHVPFCVSLCPYCDFVVLAGGAARGPRNRVAAFVAALEAELHLRADALDAMWGPPPRTSEDGDGPQGARRQGARAEGARPARTRPARTRPEAARPPLDRPALRSLYLGGGTPTLLPSDDVDRLVSLVRARYGLAPDAEITVEANPGADERGNSQRLAAAGVRRYSIGAQSFDPSDLRELGRRHRPADIARAVADARAAGIRSISLDLLYDIPGQSLDTWRATLDAAIASEPDHLSLYALTLDDPVAEGLTGPLGDHLPTTAGARRWRSRAQARQDDDRAAEMYELADDRLAAAGFAWYEISNWARPGHQSRHNLAYWTREPFEAVGPGAHAFDGRSRRWNAARLDGYIAALSPADGLAPSLPPGGAERLDAAMADAERIVLGLRTRRGLSGVLGAMPPLGDHASWAIGADLLERTADDRLVLTIRGRLLSNELFARLV